jgi:hypothetical protein
MTHIQTLWKSASVVLAVLALSRIADSQSVSSAQNAAPSPVQSQAGNPVTMTECEGTNNCATWTFLGTQGNGQWPSGEIANLSVEKFDTSSAVIRRADSTGSSAGLTAVYKGTRHGNRIGGEYTSSWPGHWANQEGNWYATIETAPQTPPTVIRVCDNIRCGTLTWDNGVYDAVWADIPHVSTISVVSFRADSVEMSMTDHTDGKTYAIKGKISSEGNSIINGEVWGTNNNYFNHYSAYWGAALRDHPPTTAQQTQPHVVVPVVPAVCFPWFFGLVCG